MFRFILCHLTLLFSIHAAEPSAPVSENQDKTPEVPLMPTSLPKEPRSEFAASVTTRVSARTMNLSVPSPRGLIMDRNGAVYANNRIVYHLALQFPEFSKPTDEFILDWAKKRLTIASQITDQPWNISDKSLLEHYKFRRWLPLQSKTVFEEGDVSKVSSKLINGLIFHPFYMRNYPKAKSAAHIIGYVRSQGKLPTGPIAYGDPLWEDTYGAEGLEKIFNTQLEGQSGSRKIVIDSDGTRLTDEFVTKPEVGESIVLTLDAKWQKKAEQTLAKNAKKGALVLIDIRTGEVLTLASYPSYDINVWVPSISQKSFDRLRNDEEAPMFARAFQARYPPASTFKSIVAATVVDNGTIKPEGKIDCPVKIQIGNKFFHNHSKTRDGFLDAKKALARSNNCWFYQLGVQSGAESFLAVARQLGFGTKTGLPLFNETSGLVPTREYMMKKYGRPFTDGDAANLSIGQGSLAASPLQVAQAMAGIANGKELPKLQLIKQIQTYGGSVVDAPTVEARSKFSLSPEAIEQVHMGMYQVIHAPYGTGKRAALDFTEMVGKTGTAQWVQGKELAWFAGFFPYQSPRFAYAVLYEGSKGESVSGGQKAAPIIRSFLNSISNDLMQYMNSAAIVKEIEEIPNQDASTKTLKALPVEE